MEELNIDNYPMILQGVLLNDKQYVTTDTPPVPGRSIVVNAVGKTFLYMGDDPRKGSSESMVKDLGGYDTGFLAMETEKAIAGASERYVWVTQRVDSRRRFPGC